MINKYWASVLLYDNKIKFWKVSPNIKSCVDDFYKDFYYFGENMNEFINNPKCKVENKLFEESDEITNDMIFNELTTEWFRQWEMIENYKGSKPYDKYEFIINKIELNDISDLMQKCVEKGYTFMFSQSGLPDNYNLNVAYMNENLKNKSVRLSYHKEKGLIHQYADEEHKHEEFNSIDKVMDFLYNELEV